MIAETEVRSARQVRRQVLAPQPSSVAMTVAHGHKVVWSELDVDR